MLSKLLALPAELIEEVVSWIGTREDLLALALTCSALHGVVVPAHLQHSKIFIWRDHGSFWAFFNAHPKLARNVRELTLHDHTHPKGYADSLDVLQDTEAALRAMSRLRTLTVSAYEFTMPSNSGVEHSLATTVCRAVPVVEHLHIDMKSSNYKEFLNPNKMVEPFLSMCVLHTLDFQGSLLGDRLWPNFCEMLLRCHRLQSLSMPYFVWSQSSPLNARLQPDMPFLPCLAKLEVESCIDRVLEAVVAMLIQEPPITEIRWIPRGLLHLAQPFPKLPSLRVLDVYESHFMSRWLEGRPPGSVKLRKLSTSMSPTVLLKMLQALDPSTLRHLHIPAHCPMDILKQVALMHPMLEEVVFPRSCGDEYRPVGANPRPARTGWGVVPFASLLGAQPRLNKDMVTPHEALALFPALRSMSQVDTGNKRLNDAGYQKGSNILSRPRTPPAGTARTVAALRKQYPELLMVNNWWLR